MKLYTEEQVIQMLKARENGLSVDYILLVNEPLELPTDEEIELKSVEYSTDSETKEFYKYSCWDFQNGVKWVINKIEGGSK